VFDAGIGGLPIAQALVRRVPDVDIHYLADSGRRPYGPQPAATVARYIRQAERFFTDRGVDVWVIACNTASVVAPHAKDRLIPCVDMVEAVGRILPSPASGPVGLLGTRGTISSGVMPRTYSDRDWVPVPTEALLRHAEEGDADSPEVSNLIHQLGLELADRGVQQAVLACTDYTCILPAMSAGMPSITLLDPLEGAVAAVIDVLRSLPAVTAPTPRRTENGHELAVTGNHPIDIPRLARDTYQVTFSTTVTVKLDRAETEAPRELPTS
jgi:glutamate racemase